MRCAERLITLAILLCAREAKLNPREERTGDAAETVPSPERALRQAGIDKNLRDAGAGELHDRHRPDFGFDEEGKVRPPVPEEAADPRGDVDRRELVNGAGGKAARSD